MTEENKQDPNELNRYPLGYNHAFVFPRWWHPQFQPIYDDHANYNTNAKDYYDYLARDNASDELLYQAVNRLLRRNLSVQSTPAIQMIKEGDWIDNGTCPVTYNDLITLKCHLVLSKHTKEKDFPLVGHVTLPNACVIESDGLYVPDVQSLINQAFEYIDLLFQAAGGDAHKLEIPREVDVSNSNDLANGVELGEYTNDTNIEITWRVGSTRGTSKYRAGDLKGNNCHLTAWNMVDTVSDTQQVELFTKILADGKLYATGANKLYLSRAGNMTWQLNAKSNGEVYYNTVNPNYQSGTNGQNHEMYIDRVIIYDIVSI